MYPWTEAIKGMSLPITSNQCCRDVLSEIEIDCCTDSILEVIFSASLRVKPCNKGMLFLGIAINDILGKENAFSLYQRIEGFIEAHVLYEL